MGKVFIYAIKLPTSKLMLNFNLKLNNKCIKLLVFRDRSKGKDNFPYSRHLGKETGH